MREILFRGKDRTGILNHSWLYGSLDNLNEDFWYITYKDRWGNKITADVDKNTVGQFTGLTDKNGKKIFEGDIVKYEDTPASDYYRETVIVNRGEVKFADGEYYVTERETVTMGDLIYNGTMECEVIGNIHDNPELLEV